MCPTWSIAGARTSFLPPAATTTTPGRPPPPTPTSAPTTHRGNSLPSRKAAMFANLVAILRPGPVALRNLLRRAASGPRQPQVARRLPRPLHLEELEVRLVPSVPQPDHVVVVMEENHGYNEI